MIVVGRCNGRNAAKPLPETSDASTIKDEARLTDTPHMVARN